MSIAKMLLLLLISFFIASCATTRVGPEFEAGRIYSWDIAKKDAWSTECDWHPTKVFAAIKARSYTDRLKSQGKTQTFIEGFYHGYRMYYYNQLGAKCDEP